jgi:hypothetical protein
MARHIDHDDAMELAVRLTCSYLSTSSSGSTNAEDLILDYYRQIRNVEARLANEYAGGGWETGEAEEAEEEARLAA